MPWLIEHNRTFLGAYQYLRVIVDSPFGANRPRLEWDKNWEVAIQFHRKDDAEAFIYLHPTECLNSRATEHDFVGGPGYTPTKRIEVGPTDSDPRC